MIVDKTVLIHDNFYDETGKIPPGNYVIITADHKTAKSWVFGIQNYFSQNFSDIPWKRRGSEIVCGNIKIYVYAQHDYLKLKGVEQIHGYIVEKGIANPVEMGNQLRSKMRGF